MQFVSVCFVCVYVCIYVFLCYLLYVLYICVRSALLQIKKITTSRHDA